MINKYFYRRGGAETVFLLERSCLRKKDIEIVDFSMEHPLNLPSPHAGYFVSNTDYNKFRSNPGISFKNKISTALKLIYNIEAKRRLNTILEKERPDIAHLHNIYHQISPSIIGVLKKNKVKTIMTLHDYKLICPTYVMIDRNNVICDRCKGGRFYQAAVHRCMDGSLAHSSVLSMEAYLHRWLRSYDDIDLYIAPSRFLANLMSRNSTIRKPIVVLPYGVELEKNPSVASKDNYILFFGRMSREKGIETLIHAYEHLDRKIPLKIAGDGPLLDRLKSQYKNVDFLGYQEKASIKKLIQNAAFVVVPSEWFENFPMAVLETMSLGKPVIASDTGGIPEQIDDGKSGLLFEAGNTSALAGQMKRLLSDRELRSKLGLEARKKVQEQYSLEIHCSKLIELYEKLIETPS